MTISAKHLRSRKLRTALAILRAGQMMNDFKPKSNVTPTQWGSYLDDLYRTTYRTLFADTSKVTPQDRLSGALETSERAFELSHLFHRFASEFYDANGFFRTTRQEHNAGLMAQLYLELERFASFGEDTSLVLRVFYTLVGQMRGFREKLGGIDFRRLSEAQVHILMKPQRSQEEMTEILLAAMTPARRQQYRENTPAHHYWEDRSITLYGKRFIQVNPQEIEIEWLGDPVGDEKLIILVNGAVIRISRCQDLLQEHLEGGELLGSFRIAPQHYDGRLRHDSHDKQGQSIYHKQVIDGIDVSRGALPICMNLHPLSLLSHAQHQRLEYYLQQEFEADIFQLLDAEFAFQVAESVKGHERAEKMVSLASHQLQSTIPAMVESIEAELALFAQQNHQAEASRPVSPNATPELVMTMGGSGSGKGSSQYFVKHFTDMDGAIRRDCIYASLDEGRPYSDIYHILIAAGHHADDYEAVHLWADTRRSWLCERARKLRYHVIYDGSGVEYAGRYDKIVREFSKAGYHTKVIATDCPLIVPAQRRDTYPLPALERIMLRAGYKPNGERLPPKVDGEHYRSLPWRVALNKHILFPSSLMAALADKHLAKIILINNGGKPGEDRVIAESFILEDAEFTELETTQEMGRFGDLLRRENWLPYGHMASQIDDDNSGYLAVRVSGMYHLLVIIDIERFIDLLEKGQLNPNAHGPSNLTLKHSQFSFVINRIDKPGSLDMTPPEVLNAYLEVVKDNPNTPRPNYIRLNAG